ncbi:MAG: uracil phosphoribosyltransferase [Chitinophagales bacterium]|nr:uracil phosphoribosyltransferase [Chitinophagales bacterium]
MLFNLSDHPTIANAFLAELRDVNKQQDRLRFRRNMERIGEILAYEISKALPYVTQTVETPLGSAAIPLPAQRIVLATILRAGLPFHQGMLNYFDDADNAFVAAYRREHKDGTLDVQLDYVAAPDLEGAVLILCDPMLATGSSVKLALDHLLRFGTPAQIHIAGIIGASAGVEAIRRHSPRAKVWVGALDEELTAKSYIVPGLGDAGDLAFGGKL